jgi:SAM-dependent methyltransferase
MTQKVEVTDDLTFPFGSVTDWMERRIPLLDIREVFSFNTRRIKPKTSDVVVVNIPWSQRATRSYEYPTRKVEFAVLISSRISNEETGDAYSQEESVEIQLDWFKCSRPNQSKRIPWKVVMVLVESDNLFEEAKAMDILSSIPLSSSTLPEDFPLPRLWSPNPVCVLLKDYIIQRLISTESDKFTFIDLGCGGGRDLMYLAEEYLCECMRNGSCSKATFMGIDKHKSTHKILSEFSRNRRVQSVVEFMNQNLKSLDTSRETLKAIEMEFGSIDFILGVRFLQRELFPLLKEVMKPRSIIAWSHFTLEVDGTWGFDHPKSSKHILQYDELALLFNEESGFEILVNHHIRDTDHGRPLQLFIARKK